jgi:hypothetical protein
LSVGSGLWNFFKDSFSMPERDWMKGMWAMLMEGLMSMWMRVQDLGKWVDQFTRLVRWEGVVMCAWMRTGVFTRKWG